jgi:basic amino acid/polyamine antiporter, APA family
MGQTGLSPRPSDKMSVSVEPGLVRSLSLLDTILLLVSGVIGSSIFLTAKDIAGPLPQPVLFLLVWMIGGIVSLFACFAFAELGAMFPDSGGQYVYLREAYGDLVAFLYGWMLFTIANAGSMAALAVASATYTGKIFPIVGQEHVIFSVLGASVTRSHAVAIVVITIMTLVNVIGLRWGALLNNLSTWTKAAAIGAFVILGFAFGKGSWSNFSAHGVGLTAGLSLGQLALAMGVGLIAVFFAYDGWIYVTWVAGEIKNPQRNVPLAMVLGVIVVGVIYMLMNMTYVYALPVSEIAKYETIAHTTAEVLFSPAAAVWLSALVAISSFGKLHALGRARVHGNGARWGVFQTHGSRASPLEDAGVQFDRSRYLGGCADHEWPL